MSDGPQSPLAGMLRKHFVDPGAISTSARPASRQSAIGVVPAWFCCLSDEFVKYREPTMPVTTPVRLAACSSDGPALEEHLRVAGVYRHAGADGGLGEVDRSDVAGLQEAQCRRQL